MTLLHHSWSQMLVLEFVYHRLRNGLADETTLPNGQTFNLVDLALLGLSSNIEQLHNLTATFREIKLDRIDYACLKLMLLLSIGELLSFSSFLPEKNSNSLNSTTTIKSLKPSPSIRTFRSAFYSLVSI